MSQREPLTGAGREWFDPPRIHDLRVLLFQGAGTSGGAMVGLKTAEIPALLAQLSHHVEDERSLQAAAAVMASDDLTGVLERIMPLLLKHKTFTNSLRHIERGGGNLEDIIVPAAVIRSTYPLNRLLPPADDPAGAVSLGGLRQGMRTLRDLQRRYVVKLLEEVGADAFVLLTGQAWAVAYPEYPRWCADTDVFAVDVARGLRLLEALCKQLGFAMASCKVRVQGTDGLLSVSTFRLVDGYELNVGLRAGGQLVPGSNRSAPVVVPRRMAIEGNDVLVSAPEDLLLLTARRPLNEGFFTYRGINDMEFLLAREEGQLDWDYVVAEARRKRLVGCIRLLVHHAELRAGRPLVPPEVSAALTPGPVEARLTDALLRSTPGMPGSVARDGTWSAFPGAVGMLRVAVLRKTTLPATVRAVSHDLANRTQARALVKEVRMGRRGRAHHAPSLLVLRLLRPRYRSLCELRRDPAPESAGFCLSRLRRATAPPQRYGRASRTAFEVLERSLPDPGVEALFRKRTMDGAWAEAGQTHRCEMFVVKLARAP